MLADVAIVYNGVLDKGISIVARSLGKALVRLVEIYTVRLYPCRNPCLVLCLGLAVREVEVVVQAVVLKIKTHHLK